MERIQIPAAIAEWIAAGIRKSACEMEHARQQAYAQATQRCRNAQAKLSRAYDDYVEGRISQDFWTRKSEELEAELAVIEAEASRFARQTPAYTVRADEILELAKTAHFRYLEQTPQEKRRLLNSVLSNCTFDRGTLCPTYTKPFDIFADANETGNWRGGWDEFRNCSRGPGGP